MAVKYSIDISYNNSLFSLVEIATIIIIIVSLYKIDNDIYCICSDNPMKKGLKGWFIFLIVYTILLNIIIIILMIYDYYSLFMPLIILHVIIFIITLVMFVRLFIYIKYLKDMCSCAYNSKEKYIYYYLIVYFSLIILMFIYSIISLITFYYSRVQSR